MNVFPVSLWMTIATVLLAQTNAANVCTSRLDPGAVMCQIAGWVGNRFAPLDIDASLCTHILIDFATLCANGTVCTGYFSDDPALLGFGALASFKARNIRVGMVVGGYGESFERFRVIAADADLRKVFVDSVLDIMRRYGMNVVEISWIEYPADNLQTHKANYVTLVEELSRAVRSRGWQIGVTLKTAGGWFDHVFDPVALARHVDYLNVLGYDYHGHWEERTGANAPIESADPTDNATVKYYLERIIGMVGANCVVLAIPMFGRRWAVPEGPVEPGPGSFSQPNEGFHYGYNEICVRNDRGECTTFDHWDNATRTPWGVCGNDYYSYDNAQSIEEKVNFALKLGIKGVSAFTIDYDDYLNICGGGKYPLLRAAQKMRKTAR